MNEESGKLPLKAIAQLMLELGDDIEALGTKLCLSPGFAVLHWKTLQEFDLIAQKQRSLAAALQLECLKDMLEQLPLDELREKLSVMVKA